MEAKWFELRTEVLTTDKEAAVKYFKAKLEEQGWEDFVWEMENN